MRDIDLRLLRFFVTSVDCATFSAAARQLGVTQPALSQGVKRLEDLVGAELIDRSPQGSARPFRVTPIGQLLYEDARDLLDRAGSVLIRARANASRAVLRVGFGTSTPSSLIERLLALSEAQEGLDLQLTFLGWGDEYDGLRRGEVDMVFSHARDFATDSDWVTTRVAQVPRVAIFSRRHVLASCPRIAMADIDDEPIVDALADRDFWIVNPRPSGRVPRTVGPRARSVDEMLTFVATGTGMGITCRTVAEKHAWPNIVYVPITDIDPTQVYTVRRAFGLGRPAAGFLETFEAAMTRELDTAAPRAAC